MNTDGDWHLIAALRDDDPVSVAPFDAITFKLATTVSRIPPIALARGTFHVTASGQFMHPK